MPVKPPLVYKPTNTLPVLPKMLSGQNQPRPISPLLQKPIFNSGKSNLLQSVSGCSAAAPVYRPSCAAVQRMIPRPFYKPQGAIATRSMAAAPTYAPAQATLMRPNTGQPALHSSMLQAKPLPFRTPVTYPNPGQRAVQRNGDSGNAAIQMKQHPPRLAKTLRPTTIQRSFNWVNLKTNGINNRNELLERLLAKFGAHNRGYIDEKLTLIEKDGEPWGWRDITGYFVQQSRGAAISRVDTSTIVSTHARVPVAACNPETFVYRGVTVLSANVTKSAKTWSISCQNRSEDEHAEDVLIGIIEEDLEGYQNSRMRIVINNSPCLRCAGRLARAVRRYGIEMSIYFSNPYCKAHQSSQTFDEEEQRAEIARAIRTLRQAGIRVHTIDPQQITYAQQSINSQYYGENLQQVRVRVGKYRKHGGVDEGYSSSEESGGE